MRDTKRHTDIKKRLLDSVGKGEGGMILEKSIETFVLPYVKQMTSASSMHETGHSKPVNWDNPRGVGWEGCRRGFRMGTQVYPWLIHVNIWQTHHNTVK